MAQETAADDEWTTVYDDRFAYKRQRGSDSIKVRKPRNIENARDTYEVIGRIDGDIYHTTHAHENGAMGRVMVLEELADYEVTFEEGDEVFVVSSTFSPVARRGVVTRNVATYQSVRVHFDSDPYGGSDHRTIDVDPTEMIHADAGDVETLLFVGRDDLLEVEDFE